MRIVSKTELLAMPKGTPFAEYHPTRWPDRFSIFAGPTGYGEDFWYRDICHPQNDETGQLLDRQGEMAEKGARYPVETTMAREGFFDLDMRYVVWEPEDVARIINLLQGGDDPSDFT